MAEFNAFPPLLKPSESEDDTPPSPSGDVSSGGFRRPDSLRLNCQLSLLRHLHSVATDIEDKYGDKAADENMCFITGVQGRVAKPTWNRDYTYFLAMVDEVRSYLHSHCVRSSLDDLVATLLNIYNRFENRRRMGVEIIVLCMLASRQTKEIHVPDKYKAPLFVLEMLVSCRHRFQKPDKCYFWSRQTESLLKSTFSHCRHLQRLTLSIANDALLKSVSVNCRQLVELEVEFAMDVSDDALLALAGKSVLKKDQGNARPWTQAYCLNKDFGSPKEWFIKDSLLFTPPATTNANVLAPMAMETSGRILPRLYDTGFGCLNLMKLRLTGDFIFPPLARRYADFPHLKLKSQRGPVLESGLYAILIYLRKLHSCKFSSAGLCTLISRLPLASPHKPLPIILPLQSLRLDKDLLLPEELDCLGRACLGVAELTNVSSEVSADFATEEFVSLNGQAFMRSVVSPNLCRFLKSFRRLQSFQGKIPLICFNSFLSCRSSGHLLSFLNLNTDVIWLEDILRLRKFAPNLKRLRGKFNVCQRIQQTELVPQMISTDPLTCNHFQTHLEEFQEDETADKWTLNVNPFSSELKRLLSKYPMPHLTNVDVEGRMSLLSFQLLVGNAECLEELHLTNCPTFSIGNDGNDIKALSDEWLEGLTHVNKLTCVKNVTLRLDTEQTAEAGSFTERGLVHFLDHCLEHCPKIQSVIGEFTRVPDKTLMSRSESYIARGLRSLRVKNAVPYRRFENSYDTERHYSVNEGYQRMVQEQQQQFFQQQQGNQPRWQDGEGGGKGGRDGKRFCGYVFRPYL